MEKTIVFDAPPTDFAPKIEVAAAYLLDGERFLLLHRQDHKPYGNTWCLPAGKLDQGETPLEAVIREVHEETGLHHTDYEPFRTFYVRYPEMDFTYYLFSLRVENTPAITLRREEHKDHHWVTPEEASGYTLIPGEKECIERFFHSKDI